MIPLITVLTPPDRIAAQLVKLGYLASVGTPGGPGGWDPAAHTFANAASAVYRAYVRQIGAGAVAAGGFITLLKTLPTIVSSFRESVASLRKREAGAAPGDAHRARPADHRRARRLAGPGAGHRGAAVRARAPASAASC